MLLAPCTVLPDKSAQEIASQATEITFIVPIYPKSYGTYAIDPEECMTMLTIEKLYTNLSTAFKGPGKDVPAALKNLCYLLRGMQWGVPTYLNLSSTVVLPLKSWVVPG